MKHLHLNRTRYSSCDRREESSWCPWCQDDSPENECCVPSLDSTDVPPIARMPSFLLMTLRKVFAISLPLSSWTIWNEDKPTVWGLFEWMNPLSRDLIEFDWIRVQLLHLIFALTNTECLSIFRIKKVEKKTFDHSMEKKTVELQPCVCAAGLIIFSVYCCLHPLLPYHQTVVSHHDRQGRSADAAVLLEFPLAVITTQHHRPEIWWVWLVIKFYNNIKRRSLLWNLQDDVRSGWVVWEKQLKLCCALECTV